MYASMTSTGHTTNNGDEERICADQYDRSADGTERNETACASGSSQPVPAATVIGMRSQRSSGESPRCERHADRIAELYCETCGVPICVPCATIRHLPTSMHNRLDIVDAVELYRSKLAQHAAELAERCETYVHLVADTNANIESIRCKLYCV